MKNLKIKGQITEAQKTLKGLTPPKTTPTMPISAPTKPVEARKTTEPSKVAPEAEITEPRYYKTKSGVTIENISSLPYYEDLTLTELQSLDPETTVSAKLLQGKGRGGASRQKIKVKNIILPPIAPEAEITPVKHTKEPWEMTREEWRQKQKDLIGKTKIPFDWSREYRINQRADEIRIASIINALKQGRPVPHNVLEEYKDESWAKQALKNLEKDEES